MKALRLLASAPLFGAGVLLGLYGVFALTFNERGGSTYVTLVGRRFDAHVVGAVSFVIGLAIIAAAVAFARSGRIRS